MRRRRLQLHLKAIKRRSEPFHLKCWAGQRRLRTADAAAIRDLLRAFRQELIASWADLRDAQSAGSTSFDQFKQDVRNRFQSSADEFSARVLAISRKQDLLSHQVTLMQYGPGNPDTICPAGEYLGFQLAYCRDRKSVV